MKSLLRLLTASLVVLSLTGCAGYIRTVARVQNFGMSLDERSVNAHVYAEVTRDEVWVKSIFLNRRAQYFTAGVLDDNGTQDYRIAESFMTIFDDTLLMPAGTQFVMRFGVVPDQFPRLMKGDIIEMRNIGTWDVMLDFAKTGEGNAVTRIVCRVSEPNFRDCRNSLPRIGYSTRPSGLTGTPFKPSLKDYAPLTFTKWYDKDGNPNRPFPEKMPEGYETLKTNGPVKNPGRTLAHRLGLAED